MPFLIVLFISAILQVDPAIIEIGGPRKVVATVKEQSDIFEIKVSFIPVKSFDESMNRRLSKQKGESYAKQSLIQYLSHKKNVSATLHGGKVLSSEIKKDRYELLMSIPINGVKIKSETALTQKNETKKTDKSIKLTSYKAKEDFIETIAIIEQAFNEEIPTYKGDILSFSQALNDSEKTGLKRLSTLNTEVKADRWLLFTEKDELIALVIDQEKKILTAINTKLEEYDMNKSDHK